ncbi:TIGR04282 family arsenosugar biosynthesis glycosyltransferase [Methylobacter sp.]|uniref:TIGR04282 family arsenosugar biosynthesis glycosyltransferase n=1 Tax=Methylobacter sp. TaxID=2051955 RepID=UPI003DA27FB7
MTYKYPDTVLMVFCKAPVPGQVKTRLTPALTAEQAADVHVQLTERALKLATQSRLCPVQLWCAPSIDHDFFTASAAAYSLELKQQQGTDLGERMHLAFESALAAYSHALLMGCDCPSLTESDLEEAIKALREDQDLVLAPAEDGGYVMIGLNRPCPELFTGMIWGTSQVLAQTRARIDQLHLRHYELSEQWDLDTVRDMDRYRALLLIN